MGLDNQTFREIGQYLTTCKFTRGARLLVLGDCSFQTTWSLGNNRKDLSTLGQIWGFAECHSMDILGNPTIHQDITMRIEDPHLHRAYELLLDIGTSMCCADPIACLKNIDLLLKPGGVVVHLAGITGYFGRAYFNIHPQFWLDVYRASGYSVDLLKVRTLRALPGKVPRDKSAKEFCYMALESEREFFDDLGIYLSVHRPPQARIPVQIPNDMDVLVAAHKGQSSGLRMPVPDFYKQAAERGEEPILCSYTEAELNSLRHL